MKTCNLAALWRAVANSAAWRGSLVGNSDPQPLEVFDAEIARQRQAVRDAGRLKKFAMLPCPHGCADANCPYERRKRQLEEGSLR